MMIDVKSHVLFLHQYLDCALWLTFRGLALLYHTLFLQLWLG
jgi:hypothetical protein